MVTSKKDLFKRLFSDASKCVENRGCYRLNP